MPRPDLDRPAAELQRRLAAGEQVLRPIALQSTARPYEEMLAVGRDPDRDAAWLARLTPDSCEGDLLLAARRIDDVRWKCRRHPRRQSADWSRSVPAAAAICRPNCANTDSSRSGGSSSAMPRLSTDSGHLEVLHHRVV